MSISNDLSRKLSSNLTTPTTCRKIKAEAPSSTANLGPGFDTFGLALDLFHDTVEIEAVSGRGVTVTVQGVDSELVSKEVKRNTAGLVASIIMETAKSHDGIKISLTKGIPVGKGLGSSASSAVACVLAFNELFRLELNSEELVALAAQGEVASAGTAHYDNVAAAALGGFVIVTHEPLRLARLDPPPNLEVAIAIPKVELPLEKTKMMRDMLPKSIDFHNVISNVSHASLFVAGITLSSIEMMGQAMVDSIVEPIRSRNIPMFRSVKTTAIKAGASGVAISGAGPTMVALCDRTRVNARSVANAMKDAFEAGGVTCEEYSAKPSNGAKIVVG
jgi:homoserine kinase